MKVMVLFILCAAALLLTGGVRLSVHIFLEMHRARIRLDAGLLFGLLKIREKYEAGWFPLVIYVNGRRYRPSGHKHEKKLAGIIWAGTKIKRVDITVSAGIKEDGAASVILCGILREMIKNIMTALEPEELCVMAKPEFARSTLWLEMEGIAKINPAQIICAALKRKFYTVGKGRKHDTSC